MMYDGFWFGNRTGNKGATMRTVNPILTGTALAVTVAVGYTACAIAFWAWPDAAATFMNALFHGLDFRKLQSGPALFSFGSFLFALAVAVVWAFVLGTVYGWCLRRFGGEPNHA
jgi:small-conductance mechanosensitive channel